MMVEGTLSCFRHGVQIFQQNSWGRPEIEAALRLLNGSRELIRSAQGVPEGSIRARR